ncbi:MAG TPA: glycoside hydrolase family 15 protein, partial [Gemmataceae bacterium]|nr:glycoside hydrolase family 15 protein [Gemmataceae bacterium]
DVLAKLHLYALLAPHLEVGGWHNNGHRARTNWGDVLTAHKNSTWLAMAATVPFARCSCGYVGVNDGWQDLADNFRMDWQYDCALDGNIALTAELDLSRGREFVLGLAFGDSLHQSLVNLSQALAAPFSVQRERYVQQWQRACAHVAPAPAQVTGDGGRLYEASHSVLLAHEDKTYDGALIAGLSTPWGEAKGDEDLGGYHLVWTRDMYQAATGLLAGGDTETPRRALIYLACTQRDDGGFYQNFWIDGTPYWRGIQLDEVSFPVLLAWRLQKAGALGGFDPWPMVRRAAGYLIRQGPATAQERWEENGGYSPSTLAANIAALVCAASFARSRGEPATAQYLEEYADFLESHIIPWTVTTEGELLPGVRRHFIRIHPVNLDDPSPDEDANHGLLEIRNRPPGTPCAFPAKNVVDAGFLELVRYGILKPGDPLVEDSLRVVDAVLKVQTPAGPCWRRYNHDGYGQRADGGPFLGWGMGHAWPLLTGERGHYELAAGRDPRPYVRTMEGFATETGLLPEQVWTLPDLPGALMRFGKPTGSAMPLVWAHAEYVKLVRSAADGQVFDLIPEVAGRYRQRRGLKLLEVWKFNRQVRQMKPGQTLRVQASAPFRLRWTADEWRHATDTASSPTAVGEAFVDVAVPPSQRAPVRFTFYWTGEERWEGRDYAVAVG